MDTTRTTKNLGASSIRIFGVGAARRVDGPEDQEGDELGRGGGTGFEDEVGSEWF